MASCAISHTHRELFLLKLIWCGVQNRNLFITWYLNPPFCFFVWFFGIIYTSAYISFSFPSRNQTKNHWNWQRKFMRKSSIISHQLATCNVQLRNTGDVYYLFTIDMLYTACETKDPQQKKKDLTFPRIDRCNCKMPNTINQPAHIEVRGSLSYL